MVCTPLVTETGTVVGIACGPARRYRRFYGNCHQCKARTAQARRWDGVYYGYSEYCLRCGVLWQDGSDSGTNRATAKRWWNEAMPAREFDTWVANQQRSYFSEATDA